MAPESALNCYARLLPSRTGNMAEVVANRIHQGLDVSVVPQPTDCQKYIGGLCCHGVSTSSKWIALLEAPRPQFQSPRPNSIFQGSLLKSQVPGLPFQLFFVQRSNPQNIICFLLQLVVLSQGYLEDNNKYVTET